MNTSETLLLDDWRFTRGDPQGAEAPSFDDGAWQRVSIPHDWAIDGPFDKTIDMQTVAITENQEKVATEKTGRTGSLPWIGVGWYRREIELPAGCTYAELVFDGAMANSRIFLDGEEIGGRPYGYVTFSVDISRFARASAPHHTLAVRLFTEPDSSRWYPGAGLYRPVRLLAGGAAGFDRVGTFVRTAALDAASATVAVTVQLRRAAARAPQTVHATLLAPNGGVAATGAAPVRKDAAEIALNVPGPRAWTPESPTLYTLRIELREVGGTTLDALDERIGIRTARVTERGFELNGEARKFRGVCLHHDFGPLGAAFSKDAFRRQVRILKDLGCDAIRTAHNMPAPWFVDLCDELGMMVCAESFDAWYTYKCRNDYAKFFREHWRQDLADLVLRLRNHPSIMIWSLGNEMRDQDTDEGVVLAREIQEYCRAMDPTRPMTYGVHVPDIAIKWGVMQLSDVAGVNYKLDRFEAVRAVARRGVVLSAESASAVSSRGVYKFPAEAHPFTAYPDGQCSSYDLEWGPWGNPVDDDFAMQEDHAWTMGQFVWSGFDYLGEPSPYDGYWPSRSSYFGILDLAGLPKDRYWLYRIQWNPDSPTLHVLPHWTWPGREGLVTPVYCYTSWPEAELFVNGRSLGRKGKDPTSRFDRYRIRWQEAVYAPGDIRVVAYDDSGKPVAEKSLRTAGAFHHVGLAADRTEIPRSRAGDTPSLAFIEIDVVDRDGTLCPEAACDFTFSASGAIRFKGACNGDATSLQSFTAGTMRAFHGRLVAVVEASRTPGSGTLIVAAPGMPAVKIDFRVI